MRALCLSLFLSVSLSLFSQITVTVENTPLRAALKKIEQVSDYKFFYNEKLAGLDQAVTFSVSNATIAQTMQKVLAGKELTYKMESDNVVVLLHKEAVSQKTKTITGTIVDEAGEPVIGASVAVKGTSLGTITNVDGEYTLSNVPESAEVTISFIGYKTMTFPAGAKALTKVTMKEDSEMLDEVVVVGYGSQKKANLTGAVGMITAEDINSSFSMWNYDVRSDDAYKGGNGTEDGDVFHSLDISQGIMTTAWNISDMWQRLYNCISRVNTALQLLEQVDESTYSLKQQRIAEMRFLRAHGHFLLKRLYKKIPFANDANLSPEEYNYLSNTTYNNDEGWQQIADDFQFAYDNLPVKQADKGRPAKAAAAAYLAKTYLYKAYHQDNADSHEVTSLSTEDLVKVVQYTDNAIMSAGGYGLESDFHNNFRPEPQYENGVESLWAMQYSMNDGTNNGNCNWSYGLIVPNIPGVTDGGCDFYKPSQNLVNAFKTDANGHPLLDSFNNTDYNSQSDYADPRLFLTVGMPGFPYEFNKNYMMDQSTTWSRSNGLYGYYVTLKQNVDPDGDYLIKGAWWGSPMNRIVLRYSDVLLMRAEALIQLNDGRIAEAISLINEVRNRAKQSTAMIADYEMEYGVRFNIQPYTGSYSQADALKLLKFERRVELALESERFFDLVRWGEAAEVLNKFYAEEAADCTIYTNASFTKNKNEYLPIPFAQMSASNGNYTQNCGNW